MFRTLAEVQAANKAAGRFWFSPSSMRFFRTQLVSDLITRGDRQFFVTSEQFVGSDGSADARLFTVREVLEDGAQIDDLDGFQAHADLDSALAAIQTVEA